MICLISTPSVSDCVTLPDLPFPGHMLYDYMLKQMGVQEMSVVRMVCHRHRNTKETVGEGAEEGVEGQSIKEGQLLATLASLCAIHSQPVCFGVVHIYISCCASFPTTYSSTPMLYYYKSPS